MYYENVKIKYKTSWFLADYDHPPPPHTHTHTHTHKVTHTHIQCTCTVCIVLNEDIKVWLSNVFNHHALHM